MSVRFVITSDHKAPDKTLDFMANAAENVFNRAVVKTLEPERTPIHTVLAIQEQLGTIAHLIAEIDEVIKNQDETRLEQILVLITANTAGLAAQAMLLDYTINKQD